ncbi:FAD-binding domain-containing protein [Lindgomyces ingoldianus]|uniref:FAD-binding domain-containing protein n=1 Tax=Lindgomyces ingoldianus TaxID=673940 RepID=A0ACB6QZ23_9PLEO|nr:FAD-binding domain-containing protein [Lindgomyces ingoldianus]KAF2472309.1 FAD-binding domain-containing protein [Lindgomyces ingoldianus]
MSALKALQTEFPASQILLPETEAYKTSNSTYLAQQNSDIKPAAIFQAADAKDVVKFIQLVSPFTKDEDFAFAIRGAGANPLPYGNNIGETGTTLDLSRLDEIDVGENSVSIGAGARWGAVYDALDGTGRGVSGNRSAKGGIGGLALQGGVSFFSSREGFVCDNVLNYEVVLASGEIVNANAKENSDLWIALRGGGNNFGVITRFNLRTFPQGRFWGGSVYYFGPSFPSQVEALVSELNKPDATKESHLMISAGFSHLFGPQAMCMNQVYYTQEVEKPDVLEPFVSVSPQIDSMNSMRMMTLKEAASEQAAASQQVRCSYMNATVKADAETLKQAYEFYTSSVATINTTTEGLTCSLTFQPYALSFLESSASQGGNSLGLDTSSGSLVSVLLLSYWSKREDDQKIKETMRGVLEKIEQDSNERGTAVSFKYMNYASEFQDPISSYGSENKKRLQDVSRKYDPQGLFQKAVPGGFKIFP